MSISSDLKKNILPSVHKQINAIYQRRLTKYLNLVAINGNTNQQMVNSLVDKCKADEEELIRLEKEIRSAR